MLLSKMEIAIKSVAQSRRTQIQTIRLSLWFTSNPVEKQWARQLDAEYHIVKPYENSEALENPQDIQK